MAKLFGIPLLNNYQILDADVARKFFMSDKEEITILIKGRKLCIITIL